MAYGTLKEVGWVNAFTSGKYATDNYVKYQIDESSRKLRVIVTRQRVRSLDSYHSYDGPTNNGCKFVNGDKDDAYPKGYDTNDSIKVSGNGTVNIPSNADRDIGAIYTYNDDGSVPSVSLSTQMIFTLSGYDPVYYDFSRQDWKSQELKSKFPAIGKKKPAPITHLTAYPLSQSIQISFTASKDATKYKITATNTTDSTDTKTMEVTETTATITGLKQNAEYEITVVAVDSSGNESNGLSISVSTQNLMFINVGGSAKRFSPYTIYINTSGHTSNTNIVYNGNAELGEDGWTRMNTHCSISDDVPTGLDGVKHSFVSAYIMKDMIKVYLDKYYYISVWLKNNDNSHPLYFSIIPRDADGLQILHWKCDSGVGHTKLAKDLKSGDNVVYLEDASGWNTGKNNYNYIIIFGYTNSLGYTYPDYTYSQNTIKFANDNTIDKSTLIDKTNNTVALPSAYTGKTIAKGTAVSQSNEGSYYLYPFSGLFNKDWTQKTFRGTFREMIRKINDISYINATDAIDKIGIITSSYDSDAIKVADIKLYDSYEEIFGDTVKGISSLDVNVNGVAKKVF